MSLQNSLDGLENWIINEKLKGYDPYDGLRSSKIKSIIKGNHLMELCTQYFFKKSPFNLRSLFHIKKGYNPKSLGLLLSSFANLYTLDNKKKYLDECERIIKILIVLRSDYNNVCWGYNFDWAGRNFHLPKKSPSVVVTSTIVRGLHKYYQITGKKSIVPIIRSCCDFITDDLLRTENNSDEICFSYTPYIKNKVHNANLFAAETLIRYYSITKEEKYKSLSEKAYDYTVRRQEPDGSWAYSIGNNGKRNQIDWHQGFVLDSIHEYLVHVKDKPEYSRALIKGVEYYRKKQFFDEGTCYWRYPRFWPIDIHNQSQGIVTFTKLSQYEPRYLDFAEIIASWTINNMQSKSGYFYYQKWPLFKNKIPYMRWSQSWMLYALTELQCKKLNPNS